MEKIYTTEHVERWLSRHIEGDQRAIDELIRGSKRRLLRLAKSMMRQFPVVERWESDEDVYQDAVIKLVDALKSDPPKDVQHFFRLSARIMRQHLIDMARKYRGPQSYAANHATQGRISADSEAPNPIADAGHETHDPQRLMQWTLFHQAAEKLSPELKEVFELMFYNGLKQVEVQELLGRDAKTIRKRWLQARLAIQRELDGQLSVDF